MYIPGVVVVVAGLLDEAGVNAPEGGMGVTLVDLAMTLGVALIIGGADEP